MANGNGDKDGEKKPLFDRGPGIPGVNIAMKLAQGIISGRKQAAIDRATQKAGNFAPSFGVSDSAEEILGPDRPDKAASGAVIKDKAERLAGAMAFAEAQREAKDRTIPKAAQIALMSAAEGDWDKAINAVLADPVGSLGFLGAESTARFPAATVVGLIPTAGTYIGSFESEKRAGITGYMTEAMQERGLDPTDVNDVYEIFSDEEVVRESFRKAVTGAAALAAAETWVELFATPIAGDITRPILRQFVRLGLEVFGESTGEVSRQVAVEEDVNLVAAALEGASTIGQSVATTIGTEGLNQIARDATGEVEGGEELPTPDMGPADPQELLPLFTGFFRDSPEEVGATNLNEFGRVLTAFEDPSPENLKEAVRAVDRTLIGLQRELDHTSQYIDQGIAEDDFLDQATRIQENQQQLRELHSSLKGRLAEQVLEGNAPPEEALPDFFAQGVRINRIFEPEEPAQAGEIEIEPQVRKAAEAAVQSLLNEQQRIAKEDRSVEAPSMKLLRELSNRMPPEVAQFAAAWDGTGRVETAKRAEQAVLDNPEYREQLTSRLREAFGDEIVVYRGGRVEPRLQGWSLSPVISQRFAEGELVSTEVDRPGQRPVQQAKVRPEDVSFVGNIGELELVIEGSALRDIQATSLQRLKDELIHSLNMLGMQDLAQELGAVSDPATRGTPVPMVTRLEAEPQQTTGPDAAAQMQAYVEEVAGQFPESELVGQGSWDQEQGAFVFNHPEEGTLATIEASVDMAGEPTWVLYTGDGLAIEEISQDQTGAIAFLRSVGEEYIEEQLAPDLPEAEIGPETLAQAAAGESLLPEGEAQEAEVQGGTLQGYVDKIRVEASEEPGRYTIRVLEGKMKGSSWGRPENELLEFLDDAFGLAFNDEGMLIPSPGMVSNIRAQGVDINRIFGPGAEPQGPGQATQGELAEEEGKLNPPPTDEELANLTGSNRAIVERVRRLRGREPLPEAQSRAWATDLKIAIQKGIPENAVTIAEGLIASPRPLRSEEIVGMTFRKAQLEQLHDEQMTRADELQNMGSAGQAQVYIDRADSYNREIDLLERGMQRSVTLNAQALASLGAGFKRPNLTLSNIRRSMKVRKKRPLNAKEEAQAQEVFKKLQKAEQNLEKALEKASATEQEILRNLAKEVALANKPKEKPKGQRLEEIRARREEVKKQIRALGYRANNALGASAELTFLAGKLALTYMEEGLVNLDSLIAKLMTDLPELTREAAVKAIASQSPEIQQEAQTLAEDDIQAFQKQQEILEDFSKIQAEDPEKAKDLLNQLKNTSYQKEKDNDRLTKIEQKIIKIKEKLADVQAAEEFAGPFKGEEEMILLQELTELRALLGLEQKIANLQAQIESGNFSSRVRPRLKVDTPEVLNAKVRLRKAQAAVRKLTYGPAEFEKRDIIFEPVRLMRELMVTGEMSSVFRQGLALIMAKPGAFPNAFKTAFKAYFLEDVADHIDVMMQESAFHPIRQEAGLELTFREGMNTREEVFTSKLLQRVPALRELAESNHSGLIKAGLAGPAAIKSIINAAERHWTTFLNLMRTAVFDEYVAQHPDADMETLKQLAKMVNAASGRGNVELGTRSVATFVFFAPRYAVSRFEAPVRAAKLLGNKDLRPLVAASLVRTAAWTAGWLGLASLAGIPIGWDPRDSDFLKIVQGNTRIDPYGGFQQPFSFLIRLALAGVEARDEDFEGRKLDGYDLLTNFSLYKTSPAITFPMALITGEDVVGNQVSTLEAIGGVTIPLFLQDIDETNERRGFGPGTGAGIAVGLGIGVSTYGSQLKAGDVKPILGKAKYIPPFPDFPDEIDADPKRKERLEFTFGALVAKKIRENKELLKTLDQEPLKRKIQAYARDARSSMSHLITSPAIPERVIEEFEEEQEVTP